MYPLYRDRPITVLCIICANIVLSLWCINADPIINNDAVTYLAIAQKLVDGQWNETFTYYNWPFYSILIATLAKLLSIDVNTSAYAFNTIFAILLSFAYVCIVRDLSDNNRTIVLIATLIILFFPSINKYRSFIIRDFGYLACYLWSFYFIVRFSKTQDKNNLIGWLICAGLSCLFRVEGIIFLFIVPYFLFLLAGKNTPNKRLIIVSLSAAIATIFISLALWYMNEKYNAIINIARVTGENINGLTDLFFANINQNLAGKPFTVWSYLSLFFSNIGDVFYQLLRRMSIIYFCFAVYAYIKKLSLRDLFLKRMWHIYVIANLLILISFSFFNHFLVSRYTLATSLTLLLIVPFALHQLLDKAKDAGNWAKGISVFIVLLLSIEAIDKLNIENKKAYIKNSGEWLSQQVSKGEKIYSNDKLVIYYSQQGAESNLNDLYSYDMLILNLDFKKLQNYDYVAYSTMSLFKRDTLATNRLAKEYGELLHKIDGYGEQAVLVYKRR